MFSVVGEKQMAKPAALQPIVVIAANYRALYIASVEAQNGALIYY